MKRYPSWLGLVLPLVGAGACAGAEPRDNSGPPSIKEVVQGVGERAGVVLQDEGL